MANSDLDNLEDARKLVRDLRQKTRAQAQQIMAWRRAYKMQELLISRLQREKCDQLKALSSQLLLFESRLIRKQKDISTMLNARENVIHRQQMIIEALSNRLIDNGLEVEIPRSETGDLDNQLRHLVDLDSLNDSDSAVVMEDVDSDSNVLYGFPTKYRSANSDTGVTVARSISDAIDPNFNIFRRNHNGFLRRPEVLETVYSVEEDGTDNAGDERVNSEANKKREDFASKGKSNCNVEIVKDGHRSLEEKIKTGHGEGDGELSQWSSPNSTMVNAEEVNDGNEENPKSQVKTYNRVMSNHRSVTKPKDVKYKRINKAKSKSLEELRGRLKNWVEQGSKIPGLAHLEHSQSYA